MPKVSKPFVDCHTKAASVVASNNYFVIDKISDNENIGLLVGTEVLKIREPEARQSKYWNGLYWTVMVICPNNETRKVCCDVLTPRDTDKYFKQQQKVF